MPSFTLPNQIQFFYLDIGVPVKDDYSTFFIVHGHTYHSGLFFPLLSVGKARSHRIIVVNRREYPGSTPYNADELKVFAEGPDEARYKQLIDGGANLSLLLDGLVQSLSLPQTISIVGWSLGSTFALAMVASITTLPNGSRARLSKHVRRTIIWDAPSQPMGIPGKGYLPLPDVNLPPEVRGVEFGKWITGYFNHGDLSKRNFEELNERNHDASRIRTFEDLPPEELMAIVDLAPGPKCDTPLCEPPFCKVENEVVTRALFNPEVRTAWARMKIWHMICDRSIWNVITCWWILEQKVKAAKASELAINFTTVEGANHFFMWDDPEGYVEQHY
ncbi:hypothetical protein GYMLUDRAFT_88741 [Collybiopsis luxurians FD-317 M1]|uniref:AB hydrolase-1 domain-containing protein n=1 Tax=Collybiopsis luxurians FD-317 M1 TaxID=944289 RepID=A0A0D0APZ8_9AGAR|nr:hypothetical protein GYMLUDRAFT_88741 [Collybiopsis luxurians FD-317 M1]